VPQRVKFDTSSSVPPKVNFSAELRQISKSVAVANIEFLEEIPHVEWSCLCVLANNAHASTSLVVEHDPSTPHVSLVGNLSSTYIIKESCQKYIHIISSNQMH
jgi:hypothetical protein